jgi:hypothetical protein
VLTLNADGSFTYTPDADYEGSDSFSYTANDGTVDSNVAVVRIAVRIRTDGLDNSDSGEREEVTDENGSFYQDIVVSSEDNCAILVVEYGAIGKTKEGEPISQLNITKVDSFRNLPLGETILGFSYDFGPTGAIFDPSVSIAISYDPEMVPTGISESDLVLGYYDDADGEWVRLPSTVDLHSHVVRSNVSHFTLFAVLAKATDDRLETTGITGRTTSPAVATMNTQIAPRWIILASVITLVVSFSTTLYVGRRKINTSP